MQKYLEKLSNKFYKSPIYNQNNILIIFIFLFVVLFANHFFKEVVINVIKVFNREGYECKVDIDNNGQKKQCFKQTLTESKSIIKEAKNGYNMIKNKLSMLEKRAKKVHADATQLQKGSDDMKLMNENENKNANDDYIKQENPDW